MPTDQPRETDESSRAHVAGPELSEGQAADGAAGFREGPIPHGDAKSIILFSDGTGNSSGKLFKTNVWRLYEAVDMGPPSEGKQRQIAYYDDGVGTSAFKPLRLLQGIFGIGLRRNVLDIYRYACRNYDPYARPVEGSDIDEPGDHIYGFGFSRGAFTMRLAISLIGEQGLIPYKSEHDLQLKSAAAYHEFQRASSRRAIGYIGSKLRRLFGRAEGRADPAGSPAVPSLSRRARKVGYDPEKNHRPIIRFIGVWDTVAAYGGPFAELTRAIDNWIYPLSMPHYALNPEVRCARHALAIDEERDAFWPLLWDEVAERELVGAEVNGRPAPWLKKGRLQQVWFSGVHSDVGGGYPDESLSYVSLLWMIGEANNCRLRTIDSITERYRELANSYGTIHDSRGGLGSYYRYQPRRLSSFLAADKESQQVKETLSLRDPAVGSGNRKGLLDSVVVHESVVARIATGTDGYAPIVLPKCYHVIPPAGYNEAGAIKTTGGESAAADAAETRAEGRKEAGEDAPPLLPPYIRDWLTKEAMDAVGTAMEGPWDLVWVRRLLYFLTVLATVALLTMPWWMPSLLWLRDGFQYQLVHDGRTLLGNLIRIPGELLPNIFDRWTSTWAAHPFTSLGLILAIVVLVVASKRVEMSLRDKARAIWHAFVPRLPPETAGQPRKGAFRHSPSQLQKIRNSASYQRAVQKLKWVFLPNAVFAPIMIGVILLLFLGIGTQAALPWLESGDALCKRDWTRDADGKLVQPPHITRSQADFTTASLCNRVGGKEGASVQQGHRYRIIFEVTETWYDGNVETDPRGVTAGDVPFLAGYAGMPLRRVLNARYLQPLAAVRPVEDTYLVERIFGTVQVRRLDLQRDPENADRYVAEFEAPADGELLLFSNESMLLADLDFFHSAGNLVRNAGAACVTVEALPSRDSPRSANRATQPTPPASTETSTPPTGNCAVAEEKQKQKQSAARNPEALSVAKPAATR